MAGDEIHDLLVKVRPDTGDTEQELDNVTEKFEETADETDRTAGMIGDLSERLQGSAGIIVGTLVTLAAGLATQVPVIGETISALGAIVQAIGLQISQFLRPSIGPLIVDMFALGDSIARAQGPMGDLIGAIGTAVLSLGALQGAASLINAVFGTNIPFVLKAVAGIITGPLTGSLLLVAGTIALFRQAWVDNWGEIRSNTAKEIQFIENVVNGLVNFFTNVGMRFAMFTTQFVAKTQMWLVDVQAGIERFIADTTVGFQTFFNLIINQAKRWGNQFVGVVENAVNSAIQAVPSPIRDALNLGPVSIAQPFETRSRRAIMNEGRRRLLNQRRAISERRSERRGGVQEQLARTLQALQNTTVVHETNLDGRQVAGSAADFLGEGTANIGRVNRSR